MSDQNLDQPLPGCSLQDILDSLPLALYVKDKSQNYTWCNTQFSAFCECDKHKISGKNAGSFFKSHLAELARDNDLKVMETKSVQVFDAKAQCCGKDLDMRIIKIPAFNNSTKEVAGVISVAFDRSQGTMVDNELMRALSALQNENSILQQRAEDLESSLAFTEDNAARIAELAEAKAQEADALKIRAEDLECSLAFTEDNAAQIVELAEANAQEAETFKSRAEDLESSLAYTESQAAQMAELAEQLDEQRRDIEEHNKKIMQMMYRDDTTNIHNRRYFFEKAPDYLTRDFDAAAPGILAILDIDFFRSINTKYGHQVGDDALWMFASTIKNNLPDDVMFCRIGGEEFAIIAPAMTKDRALELLQDIHKAVEAHDINSSDTVFNLTFSTGVVQIDPKRKLEDLFYDADSALYRAKDSGRNCIIFNKAEAA